MNRIDKKFLELKINKRKALIVYLTVGYPDILTCERLILELNKIDVDMFELGMPFSDPLADGPVIQDSSAYALRQGINLGNVFNLAKRLRRSIDKPLLIMGYYNPILQYGLKNFAEKAGICGLDGVIIPDLPVEEARELNRYLTRTNIYFINFVAPTTDTSRIKKIADISKGFIYYVSLTGVTGPREKLPRDLPAKVSGLKKFIKLPICVGFGISRKKHFKYIASFSDGIIIGSAIIKKIKENFGKKYLIDRVVRFVKSIIS